VRVLALAGVLVAGASLAAHAGALWWPLDLIANFRPQLAVVEVLIGLLLLAGRWTRTARLVLVAAVVDLALVGMLWLPAGPDAAAGDPRLRLMSFNLLSQNESYGDVAGYIAANEPDVVFLHEASRPWEEAMEGSGLGYVVTRTRDDDHIFGTLVLTRIEAVVEGFGFTEREPRAVEVIATLPDGPTVSILGIHPLSPTTEGTAALRDAQLSFAGRWAADVSGPTVVAGDFNAGPWSHGFRELADDGDLRDSQRGFGLQPSFPAGSSPAIRVAIDHVLVSEEVAVVDRTLGPALGSDHFPVMVDLAITTSR
jgi:endonuclease/exonuclease/phosphatase (EEP) superfamily protein YafD